MRAAALRGIIPTQPALLRGPLPVAPAFDSALAMRGYSDSSTAARAGGLLSSEGSRRPPTSAAATPPPPPSSACKGLVMFGNGNLDAIQMNAATLLQPAAIAGALSLAARGRGKARELVGCFKRRKCPGLRTRQQFKKITAFTDEYIERDWTHGCEKMRGLVAELARLPREERAQFEQKAVADKHGREWCSIFVPNYLANVLAQNGHIGSLEVVDCSVCLRRRVKCAGSRVALVQLECKHKMCADCWQKLSGKDEVGDAKGKACPECRAVTFAPRRYEVSGELE